MIRFVAATPELFDMLPLREDAREWTLTETPEGRRAACMPPNVALAMLDGGRLLGLGGVAEVWPGRGYVWMRPGAWMERRHFGVALRRCRIELARMQMQGMSRLECVVMAGLPARTRWVERLGFVREGTMRCFGQDGSDYDLWALLPPTHDLRRSLVERMVG